MKLPKNIIKEFENFCRKNNISAKKKEELFKSLEKKYKHMLYEPGEAVGIIAAQSISEPATQMTMRSYILASQSDRLSKVTHGLPRLIEILDARKMIDKNMYIYLEPQYNTKEKAKEIATLIKSTKVRDLIISETIDLMNLSIEFEFSNKKDLEDVKNAVSKTKQIEVKERSNKLTIIPKEEISVRMLRKLRDNILNTHVRGINGIENVIVVKQGNDWILQTTGSNLREVMKINGVDKTRIRTNDIYEIYQVLGIEAARNALLREIKETLDDQGLDVDVRYVMLVADAMTFVGEVQPIGRYGVSGAKQSVFAKANFEETKKHLIDAAFYNEIDEFQGFIENLIAGQIVPAGTGAVKLAVDVEKLKKAMKNETS